MEEQTLEQKAVEMAAELLTQFNRTQQAQVWMLVKQHLIADCEAKKQAEKEAEQAFKKMK